MLTQVGKNEHEDSADGLVQLFQLIDEGNVKTTRRIRKRRKMRSLPDFGEKALFQSLKRIS